MLQHLPLLAVFALACGEYNVRGLNAPAEDPATTPDLTGETGETGETGLGDTNELPTSCADQVFSARAAPADPECENQVRVGGFNPVVEWSMEYFEYQPDYNNVMMQPIVVSLSDDDGDGDIDTDDVPDIVVMRYAGIGWTHAGVMTAIRGDGSGVLWDVDGYDLWGSGSLAAGDIDGDGIVEIIATSISGAVLAFEHDGALKWQSAPTGVGGCATIAPAIADMDGDGRPEIVIGNGILDSDGNLLGLGPKGNGDCNSVPADLDGDGVMEVVAGNVAYRIDGSVLWSNGEGDSSTAIADFDGDGDPEIVAVDPTGTLRLQDHLGTVLWSVTGMGKGPPTIADFDGDGEPEIGVAGDSSYTVLEGDGSVRWWKPTVDLSSGRTGSAVFDFEGDGVAEVVYADETRTWVFNGVNGTVKLEDGYHTSWTWVEYPPIVDVDGDGEVEIVVPNGQLEIANPGTRRGITVLGDADHSWQPGRKIWNQHAYHITNVHDDGTIPVSPEPSWLGPNSFRSGDVSGKQGLSAPDLVVELADICELECDQDRLVVWVQPGNEGAVDTEGASLRVSYDVGGVLTLVDVFALDPLATGRLAESVQVSIEGVDPATIDALVFELEAGEWECNEANDTLVWAGPFCG